MALVEALLRVSSPHGPLAQTVAVHALSDAELKARGMRRGDAAREVMINGSWS